MCLEALHRIHRRGQEFAAVTSHTTGQSLNMACSGSGTNALDRGLEAVAMAWSAMARVPENVTWQQRFGKSDVTLRKRFRARPLGTALVVACASFPAWNAYPAILANLATGNPVLVKPHPRSVLATALAVGVMREVLAEAQLPADAVQLVVDTADAPVAGQLATSPEVRIVDFTGSPTFGSWLEQNLPNTLVFTETAGVNTVVLDSVSDLSAAMRTLAGGLSLFSGQMCTTPQNIYIPDAGVLTDDGVIARDDVDRGPPDGDRRPRRRASPRRGGLRRAAVRRDAALHHRARRRGRGERDSAAQAGAVRPSGLSPGPGGDSAGHPGRPASGRNASRR